jgi:hypothetical protein
LNEQIKFHKLRKLQQKTSREWFKKQARSVQKRETIPKQYMMTKTEIVKEKQIEEMFDKLDADKSKALDMQEMSDLLAENGVTMTKMQVAEMFSAAKAIFDKKRGSDPSKVNENLELLVEDFKLITTDPLALRTLRSFLAAFRKEHQHAKIPLTID